MAALEVGAPLAGDRPATLIGRLRRGLRTSRPMRALAVVGAVAIGLIVAVTITAIMQSRVREIDEARRSLATLDTILAETSSRTLQSVDLVLRSIVEEIAAESGITAASFRRMRATPETHAVLKAKIAGLPQLDAITLVDAAGLLVSSSRDLPLNDIGIGDRDHFLALKRGDPEPHVSAPVENRVTGTWTIYLGRRITAQDGSFAGTVFAAIRLAYFAEFYGSLDLERGTSLAIWRRDGTLLVRQPTMSAVGTRFDTQAFRTIEDDPGMRVYETPSAIDGEARLVARRLLPDFPLVMSVARRTRNVLGDWRRQALVTGISGALLAVSVLVIVLAIARQFDAYERVGQAVRDTEVARQGRAEAESQLRQSQKLEAMGQLTSGVAHDFNNLLTVVVGNLDLLGRRLVGETEPLRRYVDGARGGAERAAGLTRRLLAFSRRQSLEPDTVSLNELVRDMEGLLRQTLGENVTLTLDLAPDLPAVFIDRNQLEAALLNLVVNARDAMPGGGTVMIETAEGMPGTRPAFGATVNLTVGDTGLGMLPDTRARAFEPFFTTKPPGAGTGLGLAQVHGFVKQSAGDVTIESEPGAGTRITLWLPPAATTAAARSGPERTRPSAAGEVVLLVDDDEDVRETTIAGLKDAGFMVLGAADGAAALRIVEAERLDCLVTDLGLPGLDGRALALAARRLRPGLPILIVSGYAETGQPPDPTLPRMSKPYTPAALAARIQDLLAADAPEG